MENIYRNNVVEFSMIYLDKSFNLSDNDNEFEAAEFTSFIFKQLFDIDINELGYGLDTSTKQMTNDIGDLKIYKENDTNKIKYIDDIKIGDLVFFHNQSLEHNSPTPTNRYPGHVGIYIGNNDFIHVSCEKEKIVIDKITDKWLSSLVGSRDIIKGIIEKTMIK